MKKKKRRKTEPWAPVFGGEEPSPAEFIAQNECFRLEEFRCGRSSTAAKRALAYHVQQGHLVVVRNGTYLWHTRARAPDPFLLASRLTRYGIIGYASALWKRGLLPPQRCVTVISTTRLAPFEYEGITYRAVRPPRLEGEHRILPYGVERIFNEGPILDVCTRERAFVDCLDRPALGPDLRVLWRLFAAREDFDAEAMIDYALRLGHPVTNARLGFFLAQHPAMWRQKPGFDRLGRRCHRTTALADPRYPSEQCTYWPPWRLMLPLPLYRDAVEPRARAS